MKADLSRLLLGMGIIIAMVWGAMALLPSPTKPKQETYHMQLSSTAFDKNGMIPAKYTCDGDNINPELTISGVPGETKSLALVLDDPDAPGGVFTHWIFWNIDPGTTKIPENSTVAGAVSGTNSSGKTGYMGPCPPSGTHHYQFRVYALDRMINLPQTATVDQLNNELKNHSIAQAELIGLYARTK